MGTKLPSESDQTTGSNKHHIFMQRSLEMLLQSLDPEAEKAIYNSAVPHWFNLELFSRMAGESTGLVAILDTLQELKFAQQDSKGHLHYRDEVREILLNWYRQKAPQQYLEANRIAQDYFTERASQIQVLEQSWLEREALYHQLILDESSGIRMLNEKFLEACHYHQFGVAELLVAQAKELHAQLSKDGQEWLGYFEASLELVNHRYDRAYGLFTKLANNNLDRILRALVDWKMGQVLVASQQWSQAIRLYKRSLESLTKKNNPTYHARVLLSLGEAYRDLAERTGGGYSIEMEKQSGKLNGLLYFLQHLPFLILEWTIRRISFLPNLYFGTNYQDWIIDRLLFVAEGWMVRAERVFATTDNPVELTEARLALAELEHRVGHWSRARHRYAKLENEPVIYNSQYRFAKVRLGQGRANLTEGKLPEAIKQLNEAKNIFQIFQDPGSAGATTFLLGQAFNILGKPQEAASAFLESGEEFEHAGDSLALTRALWSLEGLAQRNSLSEQLQVNIKMFLERVPMRHTITRFPARILQLYRNLALFVVLPLAYILFYWVVNAFLFLLSVLEIEYLLLSPLLILLALLAFWIYEGIYSIFGFITVYILGNQLVPIEREQPVHLVVDPYEITTFTSLIGGKDLIIHETTAPKKSEKMAWSDISEAIAVNYQLVSLPIGLISHMLLKSDSMALVVESLTNGYQFLEHDIQAVLTKRTVPLKIQTSTFTFLEWRSTIILSLLVLAFIGYLSHIGQIEISGGIGENLRTLYISTIVDFTIRTLLLVLPAMVLWRVLFHRIWLNNQFRIATSILSMIVMFIASVITSLIAVRWILYLALTK